MKLIRLFKYFFNELVRWMVIPIIDGWYGGFWMFKKKVKLTGIRCMMYYHYLENNCAYIGPDSKFEGDPMCPHGLHGIHVSNGAVIGEGCTIMQQVTIGSNTAKGSKMYGSPTIGKNVFIGAGAKIIGNVHVGDGCRIGANCVVVKDVPNNSTVVIDKIRTITHEETRDNTYSGIN